MSLMPTNIAHKKYLNIIALTNLNARISYSENYAYGNRFTMKIVRESQEIKQVRFHEKYNMLQ